MTRVHSVSVIVGLALLAGTGVATQERINRKDESRDMRLVGYHDLQGRTAYQPVIKKQGDRWIAYIGHHGGKKLNALTGQEELNGVSILDVTNPKQPTYLAHIPGSESDGARMVRVCNGAELPRADRSKSYLLREFAGSAHEVWDVTDPSRPSRITVVVDGLKDTHKNWWECDTGIAYLVSGDPAWQPPSGVRVRMIKIYDLSDPTRPVFIRDYGLPHHAPGSPYQRGVVGQGEAAGHEHGREPPVGWGGRWQDTHGPISTGPAGNRVYFPWGYNYYGFMTIVDREKLLNGPKAPTAENLLYPQVARIDFPPDTGAHTTFPLIGMHLPEFERQGVREFDGRQRSQADRDFVVVMGEGGGTCSGHRQMVRIIDVTFESQPFGVATWTVPEASGKYCDRGETFGTHSTNENFTPIYYKRIVFIAHFNAGVRALDVRDPFHPTEVAYFNPGAAAVINNVEVDDRGYIYIVERGDSGAMWILELTGEARRIADWGAATN